MSEALTPEEVRKTIEPKSDQLNADDLTLGPITVTITGAKYGDKKQPWIVEIDGHRPFKPCLTMRRIIATLLTGEPKNWIGQRLTLYRDPEAMFGGEKVGGVRISHMSALAAPRTFKVTISKTKRGEVTIQPLVKMSTEDIQFIDATTEAFKKANTIEALTVCGATLKDKPKEIQDVLRPIYCLRLMDLKSQESLEPDKPETPEETLERRYNFVTLLAKCKTPAAVNTIAGDVMANDDCTEALSEVVLAMCDARIKEIGE